MVQRRDGRRKAAVINGHHDMDVSVGILQDFNFHLVLFRIELNLVCLQIDQFGNQLLAGLSRPTLHLGIQNFGPFLSSTHASSVVRLYRTAMPNDTRFNFPLDTLTTSY